jgi:hypothetical protein
VSAAIALAASAADRSAGSWKRTDLSTARRPTRFEQRQEQVIRVAPDEDGFTVLVANELASTDERFCDPFDGAAGAPRLRSRSVAMSSASCQALGERRVCLSELVNTSAAGVRDSDSGCVGKGLQKATLPLLGELSLFMIVLSQSTGYLAALRV